MPGILIGFFTTEMELKDWLDEAESIQKQMTDEVIENAIRDLPPPIYENDGDWIVNTLKGRRENLKEMVEEHYRFISEKVQLILTDEAEYVEINRTDNENTRVEVFVRKKNKEKGRKLYSRNFKGSETKEIWIQGLGGKDYFQLNGETKKGPKIRIKGGKGKDVFVNHSRVKGLTKKTVFYDRKGKYEMKAGNSDTKIVTSKDKSMYQYEPRWFKYNVTAPLLNVGANPDDGFFFGGGVSIKQHGFEKDPFASLQKIQASYAPRTGSFSIHYDAFFTEIIKKWSAEVKLSSLVPNYIGNYYGIGNETEILNETEGFYRIRYQENRAQILLDRKLGQHFHFKFGPFLNSYELEPNLNRFVSSDELALTTDDFELQWFSGITAITMLEKKDDSVFTKKGISWKNKIDYFEKLNVGKGDFYRLSSDLRFYYTLFLPFETTFANRIGGVYMIEDDGYPFFQGARLEGDNRIANKGNMRGYHRGRFTGESALYLNNDLRIPLFDFTRSRISGKLGALGFFDYGRVWYEGESSNKWHESFGGGIWYTPFNLVVLSASYAISDEDKFIYLNTGFTF